MWQRDHHPSGHFDFFPKMLLGSLAVGCRKPLPWEYKHRHKVLSCGTDSCNYSHHGLVRLCNRVNNRVAVVSYHHSHLWAKINPDSSVLKHLIGDAKWVASCFLTYLSNFSNHVAILVLLSRALSFPSYMCVRKDRCGWRLRKPWYQSFPGFPSLKGVALLSVSTIFCTVR